MLPDGQGYFKPTPTELPDGGFEMAFFCHPTPPTGALCIVQRKGNGWDTPAYVWKDEVVTELMGTSRGGPFRLVTNGEILFTPDGGGWTRQPLQVGPGATGQIGYYDDGRFFMLGGEFLFEEAP